MHEVSPFPNLHAPNVPTITNACGFIGVFNYDVGLLPYRRPVNVVVGRPIPIMQSAIPDPAYVDEMHAKYVEELMRLWEEWKDTFARGRKGELEIVG